MKRILTIIVAIVGTFLVSGCGEEYYATPEKTLEKYVTNRYMASRQEYEAAMNSFRKIDRQWWDDNYLNICIALYQQDCPGPGISTESTVWGDRFEPAGPSTTEVEKSDIGKDTATLIVQGKKIEFVKERGNWKIKGFFGVPEQLKSQFPKLRE